MALQFMCKYLLTFTIQTTYVIHYTKHLAFDSFVSTSSLSFFSMYLLLRIENAIQNKKNILYLANRTSYYEDLNSILNFSPSLLIPK